MRLHELIQSEASVVACRPLVIADHNGASQPNAQARIRFTQPGAVMKEDSVTRWHAVRRVGPSRVALSSFDYRSVAQHGAQADIDAGHAQALELPHIDQPGAYAFETPEQAERRTLVQLQGLQTLRKRFEGRATVRMLAPGSTFTLLDHAEHDANLAGGDDASFVVLGVVHRARNLSKFQCVQHIHQGASPCQFKTPPSNRQRTASLPSFWQ
jgi:type VI secretion system secreted protein VgrG